MAYGKKSNYVPISRLFRDDPSKVKGKAKARWSATLKGKYLEALKKLMVEAHKTGKGLRIQVTLWNDGKDLSMTGSLSQPKSGSDDDIFDDKTENTPTETDDIPL